MNTQAFPLVVARAYPPLSASAQFKLEPEDFQVTEELGFPLAGEGEHLCLFIEKKQLTTDALVSDVAKALGVKIRDIGICGLKDRQAVTRQWLSVVWPIKADLPEIGGKSWRVLRMVRHNKKLKRGVHKANQFVIRLHQVAGDRAQLDERLTLIGKEGVPNYFGEQRFGREGANVAKAAALFAGEFKCKPAQRGIYISAARSYLFNRYLSLRVEQHNWHRALNGDVYNLQGSNSLFGPAAVDAELERRLQECDIHPAGPLLGDGKLPQQDDALALITTIISAHEGLYAGLQRVGVSTAQRPLRVLVQELSWQWHEQLCELRFSLPSGSYATAVIHELLDVNDALW